MKTNGIAMVRKSKTDARTSPWFTMREAVEYIRYSERRIDHFIAEGKLKCHRRNEEKKSSSRRFHIKDLDAFLILGHPRTGRRLLPDEKRLLEEYS